MLIHFVTLIVLGCFIGVPFGTIKDNKIQLIVLKNSKTITSRVEVIELMN